MSTAKSLVEKLRLLRKNEEDAKERARLAKLQKEQEEQKQKEQYEKQDDNTLNTLITIGKEKLIPVLDAINTEYLLNRGTIAVETRNRRYSPHIGVNEVIVYISLSLSWDEGWERISNDEGGGSYQWFFGKNISLLLGPKGNVAVIPGKKYAWSLEDKKGALNVNNARDLEQLEDIILKALSSNSCYWSS